MLGGINPVLLLASLMVASTPILFAALGELVVERSGVLNLGVEGMMITGAVTGFAVAIATGSPWLGFVGAAAGGMALALLFGVLTQILLSNQVATGLALTLFGLGLAALIGQCAHESMGFTVTEERLSYSAARLMQVWPARYPTEEIARRYARQPRKLANHTYGGRNGNTEPDDGWRYRGRGYLQLTGRANYRLAGLAVGLAALIDAPIADDGRDVSYLVFVAPALLMTATISVASEEFTYPVMAGFKWRRYFQQMSGSNRKLLPRQTW